MDRTLSQRHTGRASHRLTRRSYLQAGKNEVGAFFALAAFAFIIFTAVQYFRAHLAINGLRNVMERYTHYNAEAMRAPLRSSEIYRALEVYIQNNKLVVDKNSRGDLAIQIDYPTNRRVSVTMTVTAPIWLLFTEKKMTKTLSSSTPNELKYTQQ